MRGHVRERGHGHWYAVLDIRDPVTGARRRKWISLSECKGRREAQIKCAELVTEQQRGTSIDPNKITVTDFLDRFEADWVAHHTSARTAERYAFSLLHVRRHLGERRLQAIRPADIAAFYTTLARSGLAPRTVRCVHAILRKALAQAAKPR